MIVAPSTAVSPAIASTARADRLVPAAVAAVARRRASARPARANGGVEPRSGSAARSTRATSSSPAGTTQQQAAAAVRAHRHRQLHQHVHVARRRRASRTRAATSGASDSPAGSSACSSTTLDLIALEHGDVDELAALPAAVMLDDQQARRGDFEHEAAVGNRARRAPHPQLAADDARRRDGCPAARPPAPPWPAPPAVERQRPLEHQRMDGVARAARRRARCAGRSPPRAAGWPRTRRRSSPRSSPRPARGHRHRSALPRAR